MLWYVEPRKIIEILVLEHACLSCSC
jgi:hypothetical protein